MSSIPPPRFYVYALARPVKIKRHIEWRIFYIGKGMRNRVFDHDNEARRGCGCHKCNVIRKVWREGGEIQRYILLTTDNEQEAFTYEKEMIAMHGRENLTNLTDGGEGTTGKTADARARISAARTGQKWSNESRERGSAASKGRFVSIATRQKLSEMRKGKRLSAASIEKMRQTKKEQFADPEYRAKYVEILHRGRRKKGEQP